MTEKQGFCQLPDIKVSSTLIPNIQKLSETKPVTKKYFILSVL